MKKPCATCGGTGQIGYFQGESRFLLTREECPRCCGTGMSDIPVEEGQEKGESPGRGAGRRSGRKKREK